MAISLSNQTTLLSSPPALSALHSRRTLHPATPIPPPFFSNFHRRKPTNNGFSSTSILALPPLPSNSYNIHIHGSRSFLAHSAPRADTLLDDEDEGGQQNQVEDTVNVEETKMEEAGSIPHNESDLDNLFGSYREAILSGDQKTASEIEAKIKGIEVNVDNELIVKVSALSAEITSGRDRYIRLQADFDNFRKRSEKEKLNIRSDAQGAVIDSLLPMVDSFERAKQQLKPETDKEKQIDTSYQGIYKQFLEIMKGLQVTAVPTVGHPFDPSVHEAIAREESEEYKEGIVVQEFRPGFRIRDRLIRPAMVKVSEGPGRRTEEAAGAASPEEQKALQEAATEE